MNTVIDPITGKEFIQKRRNQKFQSSKNRILYNNNISWNYRDKYKHINSSLRNNHKLLLSLIAPKETKNFSKEYLKALGYEFSLFTNLEMVNNKNCFALYEFCFIQLDNNDLVIIYRSK